MKLIDKLGMGPAREAKFNDEEKMWYVTVTPPSYSGFSSSAISLTPKQYERYLEWLNGEKIIQNALPELSDSQREVLISGICDEEFQEAFREPSKIGARDRDYQYNKED